MCHLQKVQQKVYAVFSRGETACDACTSKCCVRNRMSKRKFESDEMKKKIFSETHAKRSMLLHHLRFLLINLFPKLKTFK